MQHKNEFVEIVSDAFPPGHFERRVAAAVERAIAAIAATAPSHATLTVENAFAYTVAETDGGTAAYPMTPQVSASATVSVTPPDDLADQVRIRLRELGRSPDLGTPVRLLAESTVRHRDALESYVFGWSALEILVHKLFAYYRLWDAKLGDTLSPSGKRNFMATKKILDNRFNLSDRFVVLAEILSPDTAEDDVKAFNKLKQVRDASFHEPGAIPDVEGIRSMTTKYFRLHLDELGNSDSRRL